MDRRTFGGTLIGALASTAAGQSAAQPRGRLYKIGILTLGSDPARSGFWQRFLDAMRELRYVEGVNLSVMREFADSDVERLPILAAALVRADVDVIVVTSTREALAAKRATSTIPIVITVALDPVGDGLAASLARPGGNVTGITGVVAGVSQKFVELLHQVVPSALRFAVITTPSASSDEIRSELKAAAQPVGLTLSFVEVRSADDLDRALQQAKSTGAEGIIAPLGSVTYSNRIRFVRLALEQRLPGVYWHRDYVEAGGLMSYGPNALELAVRTAYYADRILQGANAAELPIEQPTKFELVINSKTATALRLAIPQSLLLRADEVIR